jgi:stage II sporulation protein D
VPSEMPASWPQAALRAQAIAARSYAVATRGGGSFDAYSDTRSQVYGPIEAEAPASTAAVRGTAHRVVVYRGHVATTYFSSSTGGVSASMQAAWGTSSGEPYLVPVRDPYDGARGANPYHTWTRTFGKTEMARLLDMRRIVSFSLSIDRRSRRVVEITFQSRRRSVTRPAGSLFGPLDLRSTFFTLRRVTLTATSPVRRRKRALLSGRILPRFAPRVRLQRRIPGAAWATVKRLRVARDGTFSLRVHPAGTRSYRLRLGRTVSPVVHVVVRGSGSVPARS